MKHHYHDIIERAGPPDWWDQNGTPRYGPFDGKESSPDIYARAVALAEIRCQACGKHFIVQMSLNAYTYYTQYGREVDAACLPNFPDCHLGAWHYGDPPAHGCVGDTMNSEPVRIIEYWDRPRDYPQHLTMERYPECEGVWGNPGDWGPPTPTGPKYVTLTHDPEA